MTGSVCDDYFSVTAADLVCQEMGYETSLAWYSGNQEAYPFVMDDVQCQKLKEDFAQSCDFETVHDCTADESVFLYCKGEDPTRIFDNGPINDQISFLICQ